MKWDDSKDDDLIRRGDLKKKYLEYGFFPALISNVLQKAPAIDAVSREVFEQVQWERDIAIAQLAEYGVGFGEKKKNLVEMKHGQIVEFIDKEKGKMERIFSCCNTDCTQLTMWMSPVFCPNCGAKMGR